MYIDYYIFGARSGMKVGTFLPLTRLNITGYNIHCVRLEIQAPCLHFAHSLVYNMIMYARFLKKLVFSPLILVLFAILSWSLIVPIHTMGMQMDDQGKMSGCVFSGMMEVCTMSTVEHPAAWQALFNIVPVGIASVSLFVLVLIFVTFARKLRLQNFLTSDSIRQKLYIYSRKNFLFARSLQEAFSQGILNTKLY